MTIRLAVPPAPTLAPSAAAMLRQRRLLLLSPLRYRFLTIAPVEYPGRTPHVHFRASRGKRELLVTQMYLPGAAAANERDGLFLALRDPAARRALLGLPEPGAANTLRFDIVLEAGR